MNPAEKIASIGRLMFERRLTDIAGGNISAREGSRVFITPRYAGARQHWQLSPQDILSAEVDDEEFEQHPRFSREGKAHLTIYRTIPEAYSRAIGGLSMGAWGALHHAFN